ncbi:EscU/YscU/HrcU family type III secretion system export apparatus switch protein [Planktotalea sp.]|uniref:EscU/YscU/HrcU family type III secretion system export apparatus switch protein n=1 Tax=Planktotalea sp. TaxID=2029877 RepID=UPI003D6C4BF5
MSGQDDSAEKSHEPTQKKLDDARKKGEVARSNDLNVALSYFGVWIFVGTFAATQSNDLAASLQMALNTAFAMDSPLNFSAGYFAPFLLDAGRFVAMFAALPASLIVLALIGQKALLFTPSKLQPKLSRISILKNAKNKFGRSGLFEFAKSFVKLMVYSMCLAIFLRANLDVIVGSPAGSDRNALLVLFDLLKSFLGLAVLIALIIAAIDFGWQVYEHQRKNRMSHKELRDEMKDSEGDPHLKQARRGRAQEVAMNQMMSDVPFAEVVIVNPTHYAVALKWEGARDAAPICVAKGVDEIALRIRAIAEDAQVPIHSDPPTARALFAVVEIGSEIKPEHYAAVAIAIRFAETLRRGKGLER